MEKPKPNKLESLIAENQDLKRKLEELASGFQALQKDYQSMDLDRHRLLFEVVALQRKLVSLTGHMAWTTMSDGTPEKVH